MTKSNILIVYANNYNISDNIYIINVNYQAIAFKAVFVRLGIFVSCTHDQTKLGVGESLVSRKYLWFVDYFVAIIAQIVDTDRASNCSCFFHTFRADKIAV